MNEKIGPTTVQFMSQQVGFLQYQHIKTRAIIISATNGQSERPLRYIEKLNNLWYLTPTFMDSNKKHTRNDIKGIVQANYRNYSDPSKVEAWKIVNALGYNTAREIDFYCTKL